MHLEAFTNVSANVLVSFLENQHGPSGSLRLTQTFELAKELPNATYLVLLGPDGKTIGGINEAGAVYLNYNAPIFLPPSIKNGGFVQVKHSFALSDSTFGTLYLGMVDDAFGINLRKNRQFFLAIGFILVLLSIGIFFSVHRRSNRKRRTGREI